MSKKTKHRENLEVHQVYLPQDDWETASKLGKKINQGASFYIRKWVREGIKREKETK